jgi:hypothetical protein
MAAFQLPAAAIPHVTQTIKTNATFVIGMSTADLADR